MMVRKFKLSLITVVCLVFGEVAFAGNSNFQIAPPPIAYPYFEEGKTDWKIEPMLMNIESSQADLSLVGGGLNFIGRQAFSEYLAIDMQGSISALSGQMAGIAPMYYSTSFYPRVDGKSDVSMGSMSISFNIEAQLIKEDAGSLIVFFGPNLGLTNMNLTTPYSLVRISDGAVTSGYTDQMQILSSTVGAQFGMQGSLSFGKGLSISPFFMISSTSGTATITDDPNTSDTSESEYTVDIPESTTTSFGMDIIMDEISIGTILQSIATADDNSDVNIIMFRFGYHF
ncbi:hypothetical protein KKG72_04185 [bacterium]|nr:hypothetical protein [bacterium]MBU1994133.1 hypothetical protein [bacterium]